MTATRLKHVLADLSGASIAVIGDVCLDVYLLLAEESEISLETGLPTRIVESARSSLGGAANVAANCSSIGVGTVRLYGVIGDDLYGRELERQCRRAGIDPAGLVLQNESWHTNVYTKLYREDREEPRIDIGTLNALDGRIAAELLSRLKGELRQFDTIIINQQLINGIHSAAFRAGLSETVGGLGIPCFLDSRDYPDEFPLTIRKLNLREARAVLGETPPDGPAGVPAGDDTAEAAQAAAAALAQRWSGTVYLTRGDQGCVVAATDRTVALPALAVAAAVDPVGAGDSMIAGIAAARAVGADPIEAATLGTFVAGVTVQKRLRTGTATAEEVLDIGSSPDYLYYPEIARQPWKARYLDSSELEIITAAPDRALRYAVFDHDGTISTVRQGWEEVMEPMMCEAVLGEPLESAKSRRIESVRPAVRTFIDRTTGYQTMFQMQGLVSMVREFGFVPADEVRSAAEYKEIYNARLLDMVNRRLDRFRDGELGIEDLTLKNAVRFLGMLRQQGMELYLASGTDQGDVRREAGLLGYADLFDGGIIGSVGDVRRDPKRVVLERILKAIGRAHAQSVVTFGDGPVEIRETRKAGGYAVGIASDEVRRFGLNRAKRERLVLAGADCVVPDFSQSARMLEFLKLAPRTQEISNA